MHDHFVLTLIPLLVSLLTYCIVDYEWLRMSVRHQFEENASLDFDYFIFFIIIIVFTLPLLAKLCGPRVLGAFVQWEIRAVTEG